MLRKNLLQFCASSLGLGLDAFKVSTKFDLSLTKKAGQKGRNSMLCFKIPL